MADKARNLVKVWFNELHPMDGIGFGGTKGMSPGGAIFEEGYYYESNLKEKSLVLHHSCKVVQEDGRIEFRFNDGSACGLRRDMVKRVEKVARCVAVKPIRRKDLMLILLRVPWTNWELAKSFLFTNKKIVIGFNEHRSETSFQGADKKTSRVSVMVYQVLVRTKHTKQFIDAYFAENLTPPGKAWMVFRHNPTDAEEQRIKRFA